MFKRKAFSVVVSLSFICLAAAAVGAQEITFNYFYTFERSDAHEPPQITGFDVNFPDEARKNGVQGTLKASLTLGENGRVKNLKILQSLPYGVEEAVSKSLRELYFQPAKKNGQAVPVTMLFDFIVTAVYDEADKNVAKPRIVEKPEPVYPSKYAAEKLKGRVSVLILFGADGVVKILNVSSAMPREFDRAAFEAASKVRFQPAVHKKSKTDVAQKMTLEYNFKL